MSRLTYRLQFWNTSGPSSLGSFIRLDVISNFGANAKARIYAEGSAAPAFVNMNTAANGSKTLTISHLTQAKHIVEYQDDTRSPLQIAKVNIWTSSVPCWGGDFNGDVNVLTDRITATFPGGVFQPFYKAVEIHDSDDSNYVVSTAKNDLATFFYSGLQAGFTFPVSSIKYLKVNGQGTGGDCNFTVVEQLLIEPEAPPVMVVTETHSNSTAAGANDGTITLVISGGSGTRSYAWSDGPTIQNRNNLPPGVYSVTITDSITGEVITLDQIQIIEPQPQVITGTLFEIPMLNSLHFVVNPVVPDGIIDLQQLDNVLFKDSHPPGFKKVNYSQKVCFSDSRIVHFNSDYPIHTVEVVSCDSLGAVKNVFPEIKEHNIGVTDDYPIRIQNHIGSPGKSRVYFQSGPPPIPIEIDDVFEIINNPDGFNGTYAVTAVLFDATLGYSYLVISKNYTLAAPSTNATGRFQANTANFDVWEALIPFGGLQPGGYFVRIIARDTAGNIAYGISEPIDLKAEHPKTNLVEYRNIDNAFDITWTTGYLGQIRVESLFHKRQPGGEKTVSRDSDYSLVNVNAKKTRGVLFEVFALPPYMHEKLSTIFDCDQVFINGKQYRASEGWAEVEYREKNLLASSSIKVEQITWFKKYNSDDIGTVSETGFIVTQQGFIKR